MSACWRRNTTRARSALGNFPQAFSHLALINTALNLHNHGPAHGGAILLPSGYSAGTTIGGRFPASRSSARYTTGVV